MSKKWQGGQITDYIDPSIKKTHFSVPAVTFFIFCATAAGCFGLESVISSSAPGVSFILLVAIPIFWAMPMGLYVSELSNLAPADSGPYVWAKLAFGEFWGYAFGLWMAVAWYLTGASYVVLAVNYMATFFEISPVMAFVIKAAIIIVFTVINMMGLEGVNIVDTIFTFIILAAFVIAAIVGLAHWHINPFTPVVPPGSTFLGSAGTGLAIVVWSFCGYTAIANLGGEIKNPEVIPKGMKLAIVMIAISYILPTLGGLCSVGPWSEWGISINYSSILDTYVGHWAGLAFMSVAIIANCALFNATTATAARSFSVLVQDNMCPKFLGKVTKKHGVPIWPLILLAILNLILVNLDFTVLVIILSPLLFVMYSGFAIALVVLRKKYPVEKRGNLYYIKGKISPYFICISMCIVGLLGLMLNGANYFLMGYILILIAIVSYPIIKKIYGGCSVKEPDEYPKNPKTGLCKGDIGRFGIFFLIFGALAIFGGFFIGWNEAESGPAYYLETYQSGLMSNFALMIMLMKIVGVVMLLLGIILKVVGAKVDPPQPEGE